MLLLWKKATEQWIAAQNELLPKCEYQHITLTMPEALWPFFLANRDLLNELSRLAADILLKTAKKKKGHRHVIFRIQNYMDITLF
ncbi:hypothetical protein PsalMR5_04492 (plasmid) [Piscirickettsia salmonis]|nr:hypothetical protein PsalMR5_04492 [Piscirickettsia salmonis]